MTQNNYLKIVLPSISVIIPAYNEEKTIGGIIESILKSKFPCEIIVVNDGSTDKTLEILKKFKRKVVVLSNAKNQGKASALVKGIKKAKGEIVVFLDADLSGINQFHLLSLVMPLTECGYRACIGYLGATEKLEIKGFNPLWILSGQRAYFKKDLLPLLPQLKNFGYGIEIYLYNKFKNQKTLLAPLPNVNHLLKADKHSKKDAAFSYLKETAEIINAIAGINNFKPKEIAMLKKYLAKYIKKGKKYVSSLKDLLIEKK